MSCMARTNYPIQTPGFINNPAAILTANGIIIVNPGSSAEIGKQLLEKVRKVSNKPVIAILNTHVHGDHCWVTQGFASATPMCRSTHTSG